MLLRCMTGHMLCVLLTLQYRFLAALSQLLHDNIPANVVRLGVRGPPSMTPLIKQLLRKRNKLRRKGKTSQANTLAVKINTLIMQSMGNYGQLLNLQLVLKIQTVPW